MKHSLSLGWQHKWRTAATEEFQPTQKLLNFILLYFFLPLLFLISQNLMSNRAKELEPKALAFSPHSDTYWLDFLLAF